MSKLQLLLQIVHLEIYHLLNLALILIIKSISNPPLMSSNSQSEYIEYGSECYQVECIRDKKFIGGEPFYFIKWKNWDEKDNTWEPIKNLQTVLNLVQDFDRQLNAKKQANNKKKDKTTSLQTKPIQTPPNHIPKKTKPIQKDKKYRKSQKQTGQAQASQSQSEQHSQSSRKSSRKKVEKKETGKKAPISETSEKMQPSNKERLKEKQKQKQLLKQKLLKQQRQKQRQKQREKQKLSENLQNKKNVQLKQSESQELSKKESFSRVASQIQPTDCIQVTRINYHILVPSDHPSQVPKLLYNVDRRNRITKKSLAVTDLSSEEMLEKNVSMVVQYLENFIKEMEICAMEQREYEKRKTGQTASALGEPKLGIIGKMRK